MVLVVLVVLVVEVLDETVRDSNVSSRLVEVGAVAAPEAAEVVAAEEKEEEEEVVEKRKERWGQTWQEGMEELSERVSPRFHRFVTPRRIE